MDCRARGSRETLHANSDGLAGNDKGAHWVKKGKLQTALTIAFVKDVAKTYEFTDLLFVNSAVASVLRKYSTRSTGKTIEQRAHLYICLSALKQYFEGEEIILPTVDEDFNVENGTELRSMIKEYFPQVCVAK